MEHAIVTFSVSLVFGLVCAKWALELGYSQMSQMIHLLVGLFLGPLVLLVLYVRLIYKRRNEDAPGAQWIGSRTKSPDTAS